MLGIGKSAPSWNWVAYGKHPCARDYVSIGHEDPLSQAFSGWMDKGYEALGEKIKKAAMRSWRFWAKTPKGDLLVVGIVRDSCDAIGRPYPLMVLGTGPVHDWKNRWHLLPYACEGTWTQMEQLAARRYDDTSKLRDELASALRGPTPDWDNFEQQVIRFLQSPDKQSIIGSVKNRAESLGGLSEFLIEINTSVPDGALPLLILWHTLIRQRSPESPNAVFMGGTSSRTHLALYDRALSARDFATLWSVGVEGEEKKWN